MKLRSSLRLREMKYSYFIYLLSSLHRRTVFAQHQVKYWRQSWRERVVWIQLVRFEIGSNLLSVGSSY